MGVRVHYHSEILSTYHKIMTRAKRRGRTEENPGPSFLKAS